MFAMDEDLIALASPPNVQYVLDKPSSTSSHESIHFVTPASIPPSSFVFDSPPNMMPTISVATDTSFVFDSPSPLHPPPAIYITPPEHTFQQQTSPIIDVEPSVWSQLAANASSGLPEHMATQVLKSMAMSCAPILHLARQSLQSENASMHQQAAIVSNNPNMSATLKPGEQGPNAAFLMQQRHHQQQQALFMASGPEWLSHLYGSTRWSRPHSQRDVRRHVDGVLLGGGRVRTSSGNNTAASTAGVSLQQWTAIGLPRAQVTTPFFLFLTRIQQEGDMTQPRTTMCNNGGATGGDNNNSIDDSCVAFIVHAQSGNMWMMPPKMLRVQDAQLWRGTIILCEMRAWLDEEAAQLASLVAIPDINICPLDVLVLAGLCLGGIGSGVGWSKRAKYMERLATSVGLAPSWAEGQGAVWFKPHMANLSTSETWKSSHALDAWRYDHVQDVWLVHADEAMIHPLLLMTRILGIQHTSPTSESSLVSSTPNDNMVGVPIRLVNAALHPKSPAFIGPLPLLRPYGESGESILDAITLRDLCHPVRFG